jgi:hypothetical protein
MPRRLLLLVLLLAVCGCHRSWYRRDANREVYAVEAQHEDESRWAVADTNITPPPESRLHDPFDPNYPPMPPDDPAAYFFMEHPDGQPATQTYHRDGDAPFIEDPGWLSYLDLDKDGNLVLTPERAVEVGLLHSREYQTGLENLYLTSLGLTLNRFDFACQWFATNNTIYSHFGSGPTELSTLTSTSDIGFTRNLATGGQLAVSFLNNVVFTFAPERHTIAPSNIIASLMQPLLQNAGLRVRLEQLTQGERSTLYQVRTFARFRKQFYFNVTSGAGIGYLSLLAQVQGIRNLEVNLDNLDYIYQYNKASRDVSPVQVDQAFQQYQQGKISLIQARNVLEASLDFYKEVLGLPPALKVKIDDSILEPFQLVAPQLEKLQKDISDFAAEFRKPDEPPPLADLRTGHGRLLALHQRLVQLTQGFQDELDRWAKLSTAVKDPAQAGQEQATREELRGRLPQFVKDVNDIAKELEKDKANLIEGTRKKAWDNIQQRARELTKKADELYVTQTRVRVFLIQLKPIPYSLEEASQYAHENRLDLMNQRAEVVDAWRKIEVTASALKAGLNLTATANIATKPDSTNPVDFRASASQYTFGLQFDGPLNRFAQRNAYVASLIDYQQARRSFMALDDQVQVAIRQDIRQLQVERANFGIAQLSLSSAARGVESARDSLKLKPEDTAATLNVLTALNNLLTAKSTLINSWINYETVRTRLLLDMDALQLDYRGLPTHEPDDTNADSRRRPGHDGPEQLPPAIPERRVEAGS